MKKPSITLIAFFIFGFGIAIRAQNDIPASGGNVSGNGGSVSYTVGQVFYTPNTETNGSVMQGVQQPYEISVVIGIKEAKGITLKCSVYPNPTADFLLLKVDASTYFDNAQYKSLNIQALSYQLYDVNGKLLKNKKLESNETSINMGHLMPDTYFLKVVWTQHSVSQQEIKTFKIIKN